MQPQHYSYSALASINNFMTFDTSHKNNRPHPFCTHNVNVVPTPLPACIAVKRTTK